MPIQINNTTVIDDNRNFSTVGVMTVGSGSSAVVISTGLNVGIGVTLSGISSTISIAGTITASGLSIPLGLG